MDVKEFKTRIEQAKKIMYNSGILMPPDSKMVIWIDKIPLKVFHDLCEEFETKIEHPERNDGELTLYSAYAQPHGTIALRSERVEITVDYEPAKKK